jgi:hypothetical protein
MKATRGPLSRERDQDVHGFIPVFIESGDKGAGAREKEKNAC